MKEIYVLRSRHLHSGVPFPWQLRMPPVLGGNGVPREWLPWHPFDDQPESAGFAEAPPAGQRAYQTFCGT